MRRRLLRITVGILAALVFACVLAFFGGTVLLRRSLPRLDGEFTLRGLEQPVTVARDDLGVPDITAHNRYDAARAVGYLHAQDRFFQMDLQRRKAAGELAALFGPGLVNEDRNSRLHRFRERADTIIANLSAREDEVLRAYTEGVNAGLADLGARPFEYMVLRTDPEPWQPQDTVLTLYAMFMDLSLSNARTEATWAAVRDNLPPALANFLLPQTNRWEAPLQFAPSVEVGIPAPSEFDLKTWADGKTDAAGYDRMNKRATPTREPAGSNNWAVAGSITGQGDAILANDMHLGHGLPTIWYRLRMSWPEGPRMRSLVGVTLPGAPLLVVGSNGQVAWGFTNSEGDWADLVILETDPTDSLRYRTPDGWRTMDVSPQIIEVARGTADTLFVEETIWGPVVTTDTLGRRIALRWTAHDEEAVNFGIMRLESAKSVDEVVAAAGRIGIPEQNLVCVDDQGRIAWTIAGAIPRRTGWDGRLPVSWADGTHGWQGYLEPFAQPRLLDPEEGRIWTANNRVAAGPDLRTIGDGGYALGARARQIRDGLRALDKPVEADMLAIQLDDRARFMEEWRGLVLKVLADHAASAGSPRAEFERVVRNDWSGRANVESVAYRLVRSFTFRCIDELYDVLTAPCSAAEPRFQSQYLPFRAAVTWRVLEQRPANLLPPGFDDWDAFILHCVDRTMDDVLASDKGLEGYTWGDYNTVDVSHPFVMLMPWLARWLGAPREPLPGDSFMPRIQHPRWGASERMVVSPGHEERGIFHMPGGQSGHPLSPFFLAGYEDWKEGRPTPLLPGAAVHRLELVPGTTR